MIKIILFAPFSYYKEKNKINKLEIQNNKYNINDNQEILLKGKSFRRNWLKFKKYSFRHDSFFFLYCFVIYSCLKDITDNEIIKMYNLMDKEILI